MSLVEDFLAEPTVLSTSDRQYKTIQDLYALSLGDVFQQAFHELSQQDKVNACRPLSEHEADFTNIRMSQSPLSAESYRAFFEKEVIGHSVNLLSPKFLGHMTAPLPGFMADMTTAITRLNQNQVKVETSNVLTLIERQVIGELHHKVFGAPERFYRQSLQNPEQSLGVITSGGTMANITSLSYALNKAFGPSAGFDGITKAGLFAAMRHYGYQDVVILGSQRMHYSIDKAAKLMGLGERSVVRIPATASGHVDPVALRRKLDACRQNQTFVLAVIGIAGTTETGHVDPLAELGELAREYGVHYHIDAAWGGAYALSEKHRALVQGIELADTVAICAHKQLYAPMGISCCLFKSADFARDSENNTSYQCKKGSYDLGRYTIEGSRPASVLLLHALLNLWGEVGMAKVFDRGLVLTDYLVSRLAQSDEFYLYYQPDLNIVVYRYMPPHLRSLAEQGIPFTDLQRQQLNQMNAAIQQQQFQKGDTFVSATTLREVTGDCVVFRAVLCNPLATESDIDVMLEDQKQIAVSVARRFDHVNSFDFRVGK
ncbi:aminotransferase class V-fold PLP-dependent enzyme [Photobacterium galatheae]|uniref:Glutamate decarboxylase n=1 Tax=Photobacterium galatheae TaxID=1654360 RepID=A0A066RN48_9GAMM|nr:aminotransferase class V-fold PLP-dependent enzyme [Photobacterium galatheae]KDM91759.1 hypothetical protein EA58_09615 [Photobacterium galatheae]MCM0147148.1 aminotransferase class V-fold PLP-dependent enzyme [Photobacterium galatheae]